MPGHRAGQTGVYQQVSQGCPLLFTFKNWQKRPFLLWHRPGIRDGEMTIKIKFLFFEGGGLCGREGKSSKTLFFMGNATTIKSWKCKFYCREIFGVHAQGGVRQHSILRRVLRRFWEGFWGRGSEKGSEKGVLYGFYSKKGFWEGVLRRGSEKGVSRRCLERPLVEYAPLGVRPNFVVIAQAPAGYPRDTRPSRFSDLLCSRNRKRCR